MTNDDVITVARLRTPLHARYTTPGSMHMVTVEFIQYPFVENIQIIVNL